MDLGEGLRKAIARLSGATIIDAKAIKEFNKELQKALISADVEVELVFALTKKIEEAALAGRGKIMAPESSWKATVRFVAQEGLSSVKGVSAGGAFFE